MTVFKVLSRYLNFVYDILFPQHIWGHTSLSLSQLGWEQDGGASLPTSAGRFLCPPPTLGSDCIHPRP